MSLVLVVAVNRWAQLLRTSEETTPASMAKIRKEEEERSRADRRSQPSPAKQGRDCTKSTKLIGCCWGKESKAKAREKRVLT